MDSLLVFAENHESFACYTADNVYRYISERNFINNLKARCSFFSMALISLTESVIGLALGFFSFVASLVIFNRHRQLKILSYHWMRISFCNSCICFSSAVGSLLHPMLGVYSLMGYTRLTLIKN